MSRRHRYNHDAYRVLFWNLSIANGLSAITSCLSNNSMFLIGMWPSSKPHGVCNKLAMLVAINLSTMVFALVAGLSLFGFALVHYLLLCQPLHSDRLLHPSKVRCAQVVCWLSCVTLGISLSSLGPIIAFGDDCSIYEVETYNILGSDIFLTLVSLCYIAVFGLTIRLYVEICGLRQDLGRIVWVDDIQPDRKALRTVILLLVVTALFWLPYSLFYAVSINTSWSAMEDHHVFYYIMNIMPYLKYCCDPLIYGKRMLGLQQEIKRIANNIRCVCKKKLNVRTATTSRMYRFRTSLVNV